MVILGSTGSIGTQALDIVRRNPDRFRVAALAAGGGQPELLARQAVEFGAYTLTASTKAIESNTPGDREFVAVNAALTALDKQRDALAGQIKNELYNAENWGTPIFGAGEQIGQAQHLIAVARALAATS